MLFSKGQLKSPNLCSSFKFTANNETIEMPLLQWVFYFMYKPAMESQMLEINLNNIKRMLDKFANDFQDRGEYNAYKHSLIFYNSEFTEAISGDGGKAWMTIGKSADSIQYLEKEIKVKEGKKIATGLVMETSKPFDFEKDYIRCLSIYRLISNIINTRKYSYLLDLKNQPFTIWHFHAIDLEEFLYNDNGGMIRSSWSV